MGLKSALAALRYVVVAVLFALCGAWSAQLFRMPRHGPEPMFYTLPIPFAVLCALLFMRTAKAVLAVPLMVAVWEVAYAMAWWVGIESSSEHYLIPFAVGGFIGGAGVALSASIGHRRLLSPMWLLAAALIGCVGALPFGPWLKTYDEHVLPNSDPLQLFRLRYSFAIWQAAVGTYLYAVCASDKRMTRQVDSANRDATPSA